MKNSELLEGFSKKFIENQGQELFDRFFKIKSELSKLIVSNMACCDRSCDIVTSKKFYNYYKCCHSCEKTYGAFRGSVIKDIVNEEQIKLLNKNLSTVTGFWEKEKGCSLPPEYRSFTCVTFHCSPSIVSEKCKTLIGMYSSLMIQYNAGSSDSLPLTKTLISSIITALEKAFDEIKDKDSTCELYKSYQVYYKDILTIKKK